MTAATTLETPTITATQSYAVATIMGALYGDCSSRGATTIRYPIGCARTSSVAWSTSSSRSCRRTRSKGS